MSIKIGIVEDEMIIADDLQDTLIELGYEVTNPCVTYTEALEMLATEKPDLVLLDIHLAGKKDGIDVAKIIENEYLLPFIFLTSFSDKLTLDRVKSVSPSAYLTKPYKEADLKISIEMGLHQFNSRNKKSLPIQTDEAYVFIKHKNVFNKIFFKDILFIKSDKNYIDIHTIDEKKLVHRSTANQFLTDAPSHFFQQVHKRYWVNLEHVNKLCIHDIHLGDHLVPIGRIYKADLMEKLGVN